MFLYSFCLKYPFFIYKCFLIVRFANIWELKTNSYVSYNDIAYCRMWSEKINKFYIVDNSLIGAKIHKLIGFLIHVCFTQLCLDFI